MSDISVSGNISFVLNDQVITFNLSAVNVTVQDASLRLTEEGDYRILENGDYRILED